MTKHWNYGFYPKNGSVIPKRAFGKLTFHYLGIGGPSWKLSTLDGLVQVPGGPIWIIHILVKWTMPDGSFKYVHVYLSPCGGPSNENASMDDAMGHIEDIEVKVRSILWVHYLGIGGPSWKLSTLDGLMSISLRVVDLRTRMPAWTTPWTRI
jgi:hypothetical protein